MIRAAVIVAALAAPATAETWQPSSGGSWVTLRPSERPGAVAEMLFHNSTGDRATRDFHRHTMGGHSVEIEIGTVHPDTIRVEPLPGFIAVPPELTLKDGQSGVVVIYTLEGLGM